MVAAVKPVMATPNPTRPGELTDEEKAILSERLRTADEDAKTAVDSREYLTRLRERLRKHEAAPL